jgi:hypothetical protein
MRPETVIMAILSVVKRSVPEDSMTVGWRLAWVGTISTRMVRSPQPASAQAATPAAT